jgi:hypothetical protein
MELFVSTYIGIGFSKDPDTVKAAQEAAEQAKNNLHSSNIDLAIVLNTSHYNPASFIPIIYNQLKKPKLIGSSTAAILLNERIEKHGIAILLLYSDEVSFETGSVDNIHLQDLRAAGAQLAKAYENDYGKEHRKLLMVFADGLIQELSKMFAGISNHFHDSIAMMGAGSSDDFQFKRTYQYYNESVMSNAACAILFGGRVQIGTSCRHGWRPLGKPRVVNQAEGNLIKMIDNKPAAQIYQEYFNNTTETLRASSLAHLNTRYPLGTPLGSGREYLLRNVLNTLEDDSIVLQDSIPENKPIHLMIGNKDSCLQAAEMAAHEVKKQILGRTPKLIFIFESMARYRILGRAAETELELIREILGREVPIFGMYSFGEITSFQLPDGHETIFQNESIIITAMC